MTTAELVAHLEVERARPTPAPPATTTATDTPADTARRRADLARALREAS